MQYVNVEFVISSGGDPDVGIFGSEARLTMDVPALRGSDGQDIPDPEFIQLIESKLTDAFVAIFDDVDIRIDVSPSGEKDKSLLTQVFADDEDT